MRHDDDVQITGTMSDYLVQRLRDEEQGQEYTIEYLKAVFLASAANALSTLRHEAGLTQMQVSEQLHTKQSAIARLEADFDGAMSLRRLVDFALACGYIPHHFTFTPIETARRFIIEQPETPLSYKNQLSWNNATFQLRLEPAGTASRTAFIAFPSATTLQEVRPSLGVIETQSRTKISQESTAA